ncbi:MAG: flavodoxin family protein [Bacteroides sp.]|nr:flavodoxin family protein [Bacteroides sp.]MCM1094811.1 flavodoxin family protein [Terasakiella sp.]
MKVLMVNGSPHEHGCTYTALAEVADTLHKHGIDTEIIYLGMKPVAGCIACMKCFETGHCFRDDMVKELQGRLAEFDAIILGSPVYYSNPTGQILSFAQRLFFCKEDEMAGKLGAAVVSCRRGGASATFESLNQFFTIANMPVVSSQYWNSVHGFTPDDVRKDAEGLQTMRTLGENMAWMLRCIKAGKESRPDYEPRLRTHFIGAK